MTFRFKTKAKTACLGLQAQSLKKNQTLTSYANQTFKLSPSQKLARCASFARDQRANTALGSWGLHTGARKVPTCDFKTCVFSDKAVKLLLGRWVSITSDQKRRNHYRIRELEKILLKSYSTSTRSQRTQAHRLNRQKGLKHFGFHQMLVTSNYQKTHKKLGTVTRVRNRCVLSGRAHILRHVGLSRICFRTLAGWGFIPGLAKI